jgi:hypothetical protein
MRAIIPDTLDGALILSLIDFFASFVIIAGIGAVLALFPFLNRASRLVPAGPSAPARPAPGAASVAQAEDHVTVIAAAVYATMSGAHRIVRIEPTHGGEVWAAEGRLAHHGSHARVGSRSNLPGGR